MADNDTVAYKTTAGAGETLITVATDDIAGVKHPRAKLEWGADGTAGDVAAANPLPVTLIPGTANGLSTDRTLSAASTNLKTIKASAGKVGGWYLSNTNAAARFVKLYNKASNPVLASDTPLMTLMIPGNTAGAGANVAFPNGITFSAGIAMAITTGVGDTDTGAVAANEIVANIFYS